MSLAWKLHYDGRGEGVYDPPPTRIDPNWDLESIKHDIAKMIKDKAIAAAAATAAAASRPGVGGKTGSKPDGGKSDGEGGALIKPSPTSSSSSTGRSSSSAGHSSDDHHSHSSYTRVESHSGSWTIEDGSGSSQSLHTVTGGGWHLY